MPLVTNISTGRIVFGENEFVFDPSPDPSYQQNIPDDRWVALYNEFMAMIDAGQITAIGWYGTSGTSGTSGTGVTSGTSGTDGTSGTSGVGTSGTSGTDGTSGTSGTDGTSGSSGTSGTDGTSGTSGTSGIDGTSGSSGTSGINGTSGSSGTSGINGTSGTSGTNGTSGSSGTSGTSGSATDGLDDVYLPAGAFNYPSTAPALVGSLEFTTNKENFDYAAFIDTSDTNIDFSFKFPDTWDRSTIKAKFYWMVTSAPSSGATVQFGIKAVARGDNKDLDLSWGTEQVIQDTYQAANKLHITGATPAITIGGSPALFDLVSFKVRRDTANDDAAVTVLLLGIAIQFNNNIAPSSWT